MASFSLQILPPEAFYLSSATNLISKPSGTIEKPSVGIIYKTIGQPPPNEDSDLYLKTATPSLPIFPIRFKSTLFN